MRTRRMRRRPLAQQAEVSLTPLIDTALTLLIIFMVTTPMITNESIKVDLPKGTVKGAAPEKQKNLVVTVDQSGKIYFNSIPVQLNDLSRELISFFKKNPTSKHASVWLRVHGATTTCNTLADIYTKIKDVPGIKDVQIAMEKPHTRIA